MEQLHSAVHFNPREETRMKQVKVLGTGCRKCQKLAELVEKVADEHQYNINLEKVTDIVKIADFGIVATPALVVDGKIVFAGKIPSVDELTRLLA
jgi:small redox-active disulfide protein 2